MKEYPDHSNSQRWNEISAFLVQHHKSNPDGMTTAEIAQGIGECHETTYDLLEEMATFYGGDRCITQAGADRWCLSNDEWYRDGILQCLPISDEAALKLAHLACEHSDALERLLLGHDE